jgi:hypothetical protein
MDYARRRRLRLWWLNYLQDIILVVVLGIVLAMVLGWL